MASLFDPPLERAADRARAWLATLPDRPVRASATEASLRAALGGPLPERGEPAERVVEDLADDAEPGLVATAGPRYFGFVIGGAVPAAVAAEWLAAAWDPPPGLFVTSPAMAIVEETAAAWLLDLLGLPADASVGFVTGAHMANFTALAAARHEVLRREGWDVEARGLAGGPRIRVLIGEEAHVSISGALRFLGLGAETAERVTADEQGRMGAGALADALGRGEPGPTIVCAQAGHVNTGAFDPLGSIADLCRDAGAWLHVDGAFGLWAAASPAHAPLVAGADRADSWATDAHKWLNVPYDSGVVAVRHPAAHRAAMSLAASYLVPGEGERRDGQEWVPELSRRARGLAVYAALRSLGRDGVADLVDRCCRLARRMAGALDGADGARVVNEVVLNQVLVRFEPDGHPDPDAVTREVIRRCQEEGTCWFGGATWRGRQVARISFSNWMTTERDVDRSARAILTAAREAAR